jgi:hypothetical protein
MCMCLCVCVCVRVCVRVYLCVFVCVEEVLVLRITLPTTFLSSSFLLHLLSFLLVVLRVVDAAGKFDVKSAQAAELRDYFRDFKREMARGAIFKRTSQPIPSKVRSLLKGCALYFLPSAHIFA